MSMRFPPNNVACEGRWVSGPKGRVFQLELQVKRPNRRSWKETRSQRRSRRAKERLMDGYFPDSSSSDSDNSAKMEPYWKRKKEIMERDRHYSVPRRHGMKRGAEREMGSPQKRARNLGYELRILIPSRVAGSIIGKGGSNITRLRAENKASISVPDCPGPERLITISSDEQDITFGVLHQIVPLIEDSSQDRSRGGSGSGDGGDSVELRLLYHHTQVGCIIGKGGAKIKELRETTSTQIKVYGTCCPRSTDRVVAISGPVDMVLNAVKEIALLVMENPLKGPVDSYDPHNFDDVFASQYGGFGEMRGGGYGGGGGDRGYAGGGDRYGGGRGGSGGRMLGLPRGGGSGHRGGGYRDEGPSEGRGGGGRQHGSNGGRNDDYDDYADEDRTTTQVTIPKEFAGAIIGKGGTRIRRIRAESGANITIDEALPGAQDRIITIVGGSGQIRMAQYLLQQSVKDHGDRNKF